MTDETERKAKGTYSVLDRNPVTGLATGMILSRIDAIKAAGYLLAETDFEPERLGYRAIQRDDDGVTLPAQEWLEEYPEIAVIAAWVEDARKPMQTSRMLALYAFWPTLAASLNTLVERFNRA